MNSKNVIAWAPFSDAMKMILRGRDSVPLSPEQRTLFLNFISKVGKDNRGKMAVTPWLPGVRTTGKAADINSGEVEFLYYIPDLARYMISLCKTTGWQAPPLDFDYLHQLFTQDGRSAELHLDAAPCLVKGDTSENEDSYWSLICKEMSLERQLFEVRRMHHRGDLLKLDARVRVETKFVAELQIVQTEIAALEKRVEELRDKPRFSPPNLNIWRELARDYALKLRQDHPKMSIKKISEKVFVWMCDQKIVGRGGKVPKPETIMRQALQNLSAE